MIDDVTGILLAGGKSRRMGEDKRFMLVGQRTLFERSCAVLRQLFDQVCVVIAQDSPALQTEVPVVRDLIPDCGSLGGLYTGLRLAKTQHIFLAACDMPFIHTGLVRHLIGLRDDADVVLASWNNQLQPTHAVYSRDCLPVLEELIHRRELKIQNMIAHPLLRARLVTEAEVRRIDFEGRSFLNINTPSDLEAARLLYADSADH
jgi:molybdenum cofactor guanylyltransferase